MRPRNLVSISRTASGVVTGAQSMDELNSMPQIPPRFSSSKAQQIHQPPFHTSLSQLSSAMPSNGGMMQGQVWLPAFPIMLQPGHVVTCHNNNGQVLPTTSASMSNFPQLSTPSSVEAFSRTTEKLSQRKQESEDVVVLSPSKESFSSTSDLMRQKAASVDFSSKGQQNMVETQSPPSSQRHLQQKQSLQISKNGYRNGVDGLSTSRSYESRGTSSASRSASVEAGETKSFLNNARRIMESPHVNNTRKINWENDAPFARTDNDKLSYLNGRSNVERSDAEKDFVRDMRRESRDQTSETISAHHPMENADYLKPIDRRAGASKQGRKLKNASNVAIPSILKSKNSSDSSSADHSQFKARFESEKESKEFFRSAEENDTAYSNERYNEDFQTSWRITETPSLPPLKSSDSALSNSKPVSYPNQSYHHYETIENQFVIDKDIAGDSEIKQFYREIRPGRPASDFAKADSTRKTASTIQNFHQNQADLKAKKERASVSVAIHHPSSQGHNKGHNQRPLNDKFDIKASSSGKEHKQPKVQQPGTSKIESESMQETGNLETNSYVRSKLDRTRQWVVASQESLHHISGPPLPPKMPVNQAAQAGPPGIPYGYENVLPISQRFKADPYSMLSTAGTETTITCTSDDESEYMTRPDGGRNYNQRPALRIKRVIEERTVVERDEEEEQRRSSRRPPETSI